MLPRRSRPTLSHWEPEDESFWATKGRRIARRNLVFSIFAEHLGFSVWLLWSVVVVALPKETFPYTVDQKFWLVALPNLVGSLMRLPYTFAITRFGGRNWTVVSALLLLIPVSALCWAVTHPGTPYWLMLVFAASAGFGGGNFASSMANISFFYPEREKGTALGVNAAGGNLGTSMVQLVVPLVVAGGLVYAGLMWVPLVVAAAVCAYLYMDNLAVSRSPFREQLATVRRVHTWVMSFLYIGTFGSFIGYSAAFPLVLKTQFPDASTKIAFTGALVGSLARPVGGWLSDRVGGARVTAAVFVTLGLGALAVIYAVQARSFAGFLVSFLLLFAAAGAGNGSTYRMIPAIFLAKAKAEAAAAAKPGDAQAIRLRGRREGAATLGIAGAVGAMGGFYLPRAISDSMNATGGIAAAFVAFLVVYALCLGVTWWCYLRRRVLTQQVPSLAHATV
ncbi:MAG TPA: MFS transporter [Micromonosporaceae bacterium]|nr:MFS transporter [Micromonosporaceae bacterium]